MKTRKELKVEYKQMKFRMGVFQIRNTINGKVFIGSSPDLIAVWNSQKFQLEADMHQNAALQKEWNEFGAGNFVYEIIEEILPSDDKPLDYNKEIKTLEQMIIDDRKPFDDKGYHRPQQNRTQSGR
jgi:hypothetical protein